VEDVSPLVKQVVSKEMASQEELNKIQIAQVIEQYQRFPGDTGSSEVQSEFVVPLSFYFYLFFKLWTEIFALQLL
jgi:hypothetical protein